MLCVIGLNIDMYMASHYICVLVSGLYALMCYVECDLYYGMDNCML